MKSLVTKINIFNAICLVLCVGYLYAFFNSISPFWFNPEWTTDDALQQVYPFYEAITPGRYSGDLITEVMVGYLAPLHYWMSYLITKLTKDPIMMSHWIMLIQVITTLGFFFLLVRKLSAFGPACLAVLWMVHTRTFMQRITGGLPRGWAATVLVAFLYFLIKKNHKAILITLFLGCLLHPPSTLVAAFTYGIYLLISVINKKTRAEFLKPLVVLLVLSPVYIFTTYSIVKRPEHVGQMITYDEAIKSPQMLKPHGRFPFLPHTELTKELKMFAYQPFNHRLAQVNRNAKKYIPYIFITILLVLLAYGVRKNRKIFPLELAAYFISVSIIYLLSRPLAFNLYVPDRHLQQPLTIFWIAAFLVLLWRLFSTKSNSANGYSSNKPTLLLSVSLIILSAMVFLGNGHGFYGSANFNYSLYKKGRAFAWLKKFSPEDSLVAGHPQHLDAVMLFSNRKGYATYETAHPFYPKYFDEMLRRHKISLKAHYAKTLQEVYDLLAPERIDYFVFSKQRFYPDRLEKEEYFEPLRPMVKELASRHYSDYAYKHMPAQVDLEKAPFMVFKDDQSAVVDVKKLGEYLK